LKYHRHRQQLIQQIQTIGSGEIGPQASNAICHVGVQNGVRSLSCFGGLPPRTAATVAQDPKEQRRQEGQVSSLNSNQDPQQQQQQQGNPSLSPKVVDDYRFIFNSCSIPMVSGLVTLILTSNFYGILTFSYLLGKGIPGRCIHRL
jgi:hypothetical protein